MEKGEISDEIFDLKPIFPEIYNIKPQISDTRRMKMQELKINSPVTCWNSTINPSYNPAASAVISFENSNTAADKMDAVIIKSDDFSLTSDIINFSSSGSSNDDANTSKGLQRISARTPSQALDHVMSERKRRENLSQLFISLSKAVPGLKKLDKASLLEDGINYLKSLQERIRVLEEEEERRLIRSAAAKEDSSSSYNYSSDHQSADSPEIQARISDKHVLIKMLCKKEEMGLMSRIPSEIMEKMHLNVLDMRIMPFGGTALDISILAEMVGELEVSVKDIVGHLHTLFFNAKS